MTKVEYITIPIECIRFSTDKAVQIQLPDHSEQWIPRTCLPKHIDDEIYSGEYDPRSELQVSRWFAEKNGLY